MPAAASALSSTAPAGPTNGRPARSSLSPGCSPTIMMRAVCWPSPKTVWVPSFQRSQALQPAAAARNAGNVCSRGNGRAAKRLVCFFMMILMHHKKERRLPSFKTWRLIYTAHDKTHGTDTGMKFHTEYLTFNTKKHREYSHITPQVEQIV